MCSTQINFELSTPCSPSVIEIFQQIPLLIYNTPTQRYCKNPNPLQLCKHSSLKIPLETFPLSDHIFPIIASVCARLRKPHTYHLHPHNWSLFGTAIIKVYLELFSFWVIYSMWYLNAQFRVGPDISIPDTPWKDTPELLEVSMVVTWRRVLYPFSVVHIAAWY